MRSRIIRSLLSLLCPETCAACGEVVDGDVGFVCEKCRERIAWVERPFDADNAANKRLYLTIHRTTREEEGTTAQEGRETLAVAFAHYIDKGLTYNIVHAFKYGHRPNVAVEAGRMMGRRMKEEGRFVGDIDCLVPIPLHGRRRAKRGYNQAELLARGIGEVTGLPVESGVLERRVNNVSQTRQSAYGRQSNAEGIFNVRFPNTLEGKTVLLVDDVLTTGSTLGDACRTLGLIEDVRVKVATFAVAGGY